MKKFKMLLSILIFTPFFVFAQPIITYNSLWEFDIDGVYQGVDGKNFAANMAPANIFIDPNINNIADYETNIITNEKGFIKCDRNLGGRISVRHGVCYDGRISGATQLRNDQVNVFPGDLFYYEYPELATIENGEKANVRFTFSNLRLVTNTDATIMNDEAFLISAGNIITQHKEGDFATAYKMDIKIQIVDNEGKPIKNGIFIYGMTDIDVLRRQLRDGETPPKQYQITMGLKQLEHLKTYMIHLVVLK